MGQLLEYGIVTENSEITVVEKTFIDYLQNVIDYILRRLHEGPTIAILAALLVYYGFSVDFTTASATAAAVVAILPNHIEIVPISEWFIKRIKKKHK